ncbi:MAG: hypothetical protein Hyperionvirus24_1, partial [Hyperionvirus sp.]
MNSTYNKTKMEDQSNHGKPWSKEEKGKILPAIKEGKSISEIAKDHKRKIGGIRAQLGRIANELNSQNKSIEEIGILTGLNKGEIEESIETYQNRSNKSSGSGW